MAVRARFTCGSGDRKSDAKRVSSEACPGPDPGWVAVRVKGTRPTKTQNGLTIPTRGTSVTIQPRTVVFRSSVDISGTAFEPGKVLTACRIRNMQTAQFETHRE